MKQKNIQMNQIQTHPLKAVSEILKYCVKYSNKYSVCLYEEWGLKIVENIL